VGENEAIVAVLSLAILSSTSVVIAWMFLRRRAGAGDKGLPSGAERRLERIEQAVDAIAIEVERISEGQRFLTRVMAGREPERAGLSPASKVEHSA
jgi:hypothetical protein